MFGRDSVTEVFATTPLFLVPTRSQAFDSRRGKDGLADHELGGGDTARFLGSTTSTPFSRIQEVPPIAHVEAPATSPSLGFPISYHYFSKRLAFSRVISVVSFVLNPDRWGVGESEIQSRTVSF